MIEFKAGKDSELFNRLERRPPGVESPPGVLRSTSAIFRLGLEESCLSLMLMGGCPWIFGFVSIDRLRLFI